MCIARRDFFLSGEASYVHTILTIAVVFRRFLLVGPEPKIAKRCPHKIFRVAARHSLCRFAARPRFLSALGSAAVSAVGETPGHCGTEKGAAKLSGRAALTREGRVA